MRFSKMFGKTLREAPADADSASHKLLIRAAMVQQLAAGVYSYLPLGLRTLRKIEQIIREELDNAGSQEVLLPALQPQELWEKSGRFSLFGETLFKLTDRKEHKLILGPTHEEAITDLVHHYVQSYRDLPVLLYQIQTKFRDEPRPRGGLLRVREFLMKDLYSFDADEAGLDISYKKMVQVYHNIYRRCGLEVVIIEADSGAIGGKESQEFMVTTTIGEDEIVYCSGCGYAANLEKAAADKASAEKAPLLPVEEIATPKMKTIEEVARFMGVPASQTLKAVFYNADGKFIFVVIRGDYDVNEIKLKNLVKAADLRLASEEEVSAAKIVAGSASPVGLQGIRVIADDSITLGVNFVVGANKPDTHLKNVNYPRDFKADAIGDIAKARPGDKCPKCGQKVLLKAGIEVGHVFKLGTFLSERLGASYLDQQGASHPIIMGCYGIGVGRLLASAIEQNYDERGIVWPVSIAPYQAYLCALRLEKAEVAAAAEKVYTELLDAGIEVLFDDRNESPGVKFGDADLLGIPLRLTISPRTLESQSIEVKWRRDKESGLHPLEGITSRVREMLDAELKKIS